MSAPALGAAERGPEPRTAVPDAAACRHRWAGQFAHPRGPLGRAVGLLMAFKNAPMHRMAVEVLEVAAGDAVLEIGCGHGRMLHRLARETGAARVVGVDPSATMRAQATRWNRRAIAAGRVEVHAGAAADLPFEDGSFERAAAVNCFQFWRDPEHDLGEVRRVLKPGGRLVLGLRGAPARPGRFVAPGFTAEELAAVLELFARAGFRDVSSIRRDLGREVTCLVATR